MKTLKLLLIIVVISFKYAQAQSFTIAAQGAVDVCSPNNVTLFIWSTPYGYHNFIWYREDYSCGSAGLPSQYGTGNPVYAYSTGLYYCDAYDTMGFLHGSNPLMIRVLPPAGSATLLQPPVAGGSTSCVTSVSLCVPNTLYLALPDPPIKWYKNNIEIAGAAGHAYTATSAGYYKYSITATCNVAFSDSILFSTLPQSQVTPSGSTTFCFGSNVILNANTGTGLSYQWMLNSSNIPGATASSYTAAASGSYAVVVTNSYNCSSTSSTVNVTVNPLPTVSFSGLAASYNVNSSPATLTGSPTGGTFSGQGISGSTFDPAIAGTGGPYTITYSYTDGNGCSNSSSQTTTVLDCTIPAMPSSITGTATPCANSTGIVYSCPSVSGATAYAWTIPSTATLATGQGTTSVTVNFGSTFTSGVIGVSASNCGGSSAQKIKNVYGIPATPGAITGQKTAVCAGTSNVPYSIPTVGGASTYTWTAPVNATIISGQGTIAIAVNYNASFSSGTLSVTAGNTCGTSAGKSATIRAIPPTPGTITGSTTFCSNQQGVAYSIAAVSGATTYNWLVPTGAIVATGQGTNSITVNFGTKSGKVKVSAGNACGFSAYKQLTVTKNCREGFEGTETENTIEVYPNPFSDKINITAKTNEVVEVNFFDVTARKILSQSFTKSTIISTEQLAKGIYFYEVRSRSGLCKNGKVVKD